MLYEKVIKRGCDVVLSAAGIVVLSPVLAGLAAWIKLDSPGPVFFRQKRCGKGDSYFEILKFRTMRTDTPKDVPTHLLSDPEQYITKSGKFLRKTSLDELPQLFNIIKGEMAVIGPRPALWNQDDLMALRRANGSDRLRPGLSGWAQIHGRDELDLQTKADLDGYYAKHFGFGMDLRCLFMTVLSVLQQDGVKEGGPDHPEEPAEQPVLSSLSE